MTKATPNGNRRTPRLLKMFAIDSLLVATLASVAVATTYASADPSLREANIYPLSVPVDATGNPLEDSAVHLLGLCLERSSEQRCHSGTPGELLEVEATQPNGVQWTEASGVPHARCLAVPIAEDEGRYIYAFHAVVDSFGSTTDIPDEIECSFPDGLSQYAVPLTIVEA